MVFDSLIAVWFLAGAPSFLKHPEAAIPGQRVNGVTTAVRAAKSVTG